MQKDFLATNCDQAIGIVEHVGLVCFGFRKETIAIHVTYFYVLQGTSPAGQISSERRVNMGEFHVCAVKIFVSVH